MPGAAISLALLHGAGAPPRLFLGGIALPWRSGGGWHVVDAVDATPGPVAPTRQPSAAPPEVAGVQRMIERLARESTQQALPVNPSASPIRQALHHRPSPADHLFTLAVHTVR